jgi:uncharacterized protein (DUF1330 family)
MDNEKYYQLVLLWITDPTKFQEYLQKMAPIVTRYGGAADRSFIPSSIWPDRMDIPHIVNFVHYDSKQAYQDFNMDSDFRKIEHLRSQSTKLISFEGYPVLKNPINGDITKREYNIEIANYKPGAQSEYRKYEEEGEGKMREYGFDVEFVMKVESKPDSKLQPDFVKISYFKTATDKSNFEKDPSHKQVEALYPSVVDNVIWINARINMVAASTET